MSKSFISSIYVFVVWVGLAACGPKAIVKAELRDDTTAKAHAPEIEEHSVKTGAPTVSVEELVALYKESGSPTIGFVRGYYRLPVANPAGAARYQSGRFGPFTFESQIINPSQRRAWAVEPADIRMAESMSTTINELSAKGIQFVELKMADAQKIVEAEKSAAGKKTVWDMNKMTDSGADMLITFDSGKALQGHIWVARAVRTKDGGLLALTTRPSAGQVLPMSALIRATLSTAFQAGAAQSK